MNHRVLRGGYLLAAVLGAAVFAILAVAPLRQAFRRTPWDLNVDHLTARAYLQHYSPFTPEGARRSGVTIAGPSGHGHPPTTSFWALPLAPLEIHTAGRVLGVLTLLLLFIELLVTARALAFPWPWASAALGLAYVASTSFMDYHLGVGQLSGLIGFLYFVGWWAGRSRRDALAGAALGAACTLKLFPGVMLLPFLFLKRWRTVAAAAGVYLAIAAVMTARFGLQSWRQFLSVQGGIADRWMADIQNQSVHGVLSHFFEPVCAPHGAVVRRAMILSTALSVAMIGWAVWCFRRAAPTVGDHARSGRPGAGPTPGLLWFDLPYALLVTVSVLTSQWVWEHYTIIYVLPVLLLVRHLADEFRDGPRDGPAGLALAVQATMLAMVLAAWRIDVHIKQRLQAEVLAGHRAHHLALHVFDVLNWAPGVMLLALLSTACVRVRARARAHEDAAPS